MPRAVQLAPVAKHLVRRLDARRRRLDRRIGRLHRERCARHLEKHGVVTEPEVTDLLGSPRAFRRFSLEFDLHLPKLPFRVRIETAESGKRYVKEADR